MAEICETCGNRIWQESDGMTISFMPCQCKKKQKGEVK